MNQESSATTGPSAPVPPPGSGFWWGLVGVAAFSLTIPLTRVAVAGLSPLFIGSARAVVAASLAALALAATRQRLPRGRQWARLAVVALGVVLGFPLLTTYALVSVPAAHGAVVVALLPAATAAVAAVRGRERPPPAFWAFVAAGAVAAVGFVAASGGGLGPPQPADLLLLGAVGAAAVGYAEGGLLARQLGAWQTVSWALVLSAPFMLVLTVLSTGRQAPSAAPVEWAAFAYLGVVSMFLGFFAWYRGLALGPMAQVSQVQLVEPMLSLGWAALLLGERIGGATLVGGLAVILCAAGAVRQRSRAAASSTQRRISRPQSSSLHAPPGAPQVHTWTIDPSASAPSWTWKFTRQPPRPRSARTSRRRGRDRPHARRG